MRLRGRLLALVAPLFVVAVMDGARLVATVLQLRELREKNPGLVDGAVALAAIMLVIAELAEEEEQTA